MGTFDDLFGGNSLTSGLSDTITGFTGAVADLSTAGGYDAEKRAYLKAASLADLNKTLQASSTEIQVAATQRALSKVQGAASAEIGASGLAESGSAADVIRSNAQQGAIQTQLLREQGAIAETGYEAQSASYTGLAHQAGAAASAARSSAAGSAGKGILGVLSTVATIASLFF